VDPDLQARLEEILAVNLADDALAWVLGPDGMWTHLAGTEHLDTHERLQDLARARVRRRA
jgi:polyphosphate kinase